MSQAVALKSKVQSVRNMLDAKKDEIAAVLPSHCPPDRFLQVALAACIRTPKLLDCTPASLLLAIKNGSELGLEFNGVLGHAALIPYGKEATFQPMYKGLLDLAYRSGRVTKVDGHVVYENDDFHYSFGLHPDLRHVPASSDRGEKIGAYVVAHLKGLDPVFHYMSKSDIEAHRNQYSRAYRNKDSAWQTAPDPMWLKTVFLQLSRWLPKSTEMEKLERAVALDHVAETGAANDDLAPPIDVPTSEISDALDAAAATMEADITDVDAEAIDDLREEVARMSENIPKEIWEGFLVAANCEGKTLSEMSMDELGALKVTIQSA